MKVVEVFESPPVGFIPQVEVAGCYIMQAGKILFLQYAKTHPTEGGTWGVPAGKLDPGESAEFAARRELFEETTLVAEELIYLAPLFVRWSGSIDYIFHLFRVTKVAGEVSLGKEHQDYAWVAPEDVEGLPLVKGGREAYYKFKELMLI